MPFEQEYSTQLTEKANLKPKEWVGSHADYLFRYGMMRLRDEDLVRDLVQDTFLSALKSMERFEGKSSERTWLTGILKHKIIDVYRKNSSGLKSNRNDEEEVAGFLMRQMDIGKKNMHHSHLVKP